jgi:hypothetical protein
MATIDSIHIGKVAPQQVTLRVTGVRAFKLRLALAMPLLKLFAMIAPVDVEITTEAKSLIL